MAPENAPNLASPLKPLKLEIDRGCADDAIVGGISAYIRAWAAEVGQGADPLLVQRLERIIQAFGQYPELDQPAREDLCRRTIKALELYRRRFRVPDNPASLKPSDSVRFMRGVGPRRAESLADLGIQTVGDLLRHYPTRHQDRRESPPIASLEHRQSATLLVTVTGPGEIKGFRRRGRALVPATDGETPLTLLWFNQPYRARQFEPGTRLFVTGQVMIHKGDFTLHVGETEAIPEDEDAAAVAELGRITPVYPLAAGIKQRFLRGLISSGLEACEPLPASAVPDALAEERGLIPLADAIRQIHFPDSDEDRSAARARIAYEELFALQAALARRRAAADRVASSPPLEVAALADEFCASLPFEPTSAQRRVIDDVVGDLASPVPASRLVHGDVGSGKTVCAAFALVAAARSGAQAAMMAPTELLAEQHYETISSLLEPFGVRCRLLTGALGSSARKHAHKQIERAEDSVIIGTQALFQDAVQFRNLAVAVIDEQHRFGVRQRARLSAKGLAPNVFLMSATPIPRTLALTAYGDFDVSVLDEMPPGRTPVHTQVAWRDETQAVLETVAGRVVQGRQAYVVCPLIEDAEQARLASAEREFEQLSQGAFAGFKLGLLHGRIDTAEKDETMRRFRDGEIEILVATTVIEVGVDVPNATVMLIQNAERFGLAQLHQLRGRVGRGSHDSICILFTRAKTPEVVERLRVLEQTSNGFEIAEEDLRRRGPGELAGTRQSGLPDLRMADLVADTQTLVKAREDAFAILQADPDLALPEHAALAEIIRAFEEDAEAWAM